jgi:hypothetical protein
MRRKSATVALLVSFSVYLIPLVGPHAAPLLGEMFFGEMYRSRPLWFASDVAAGLLLQLTGFAVVYSFLQKKSLVRGFALLVTVPALFLLAQVLFMLWIPSMFLIENDTAANAGSWPIECTANDAWIVGVPTAQAPPGESVPDVLIQTSTGDYGLLAIPGCMVTPLALPRPTLQPDGHVDFSLGIDYVVPGSAILFQKQETRTGFQSWLIARHGQNDFISVEPPRDMPKILSSDGEWISWIEGTHIVIRDIAGAKPEGRVDIGAFGPASYVLSSIDMRSGEILLSRNDEFIVLGINGEIRSRIPKPQEVEAQPSTFRRFGDGWIAWDAYRDEGRYQVAWSLPSGRGAHHVLKGRSINSVAVSPAGDLIAISVATSLNIGNIQDSIYVLRVSDGTEVFRRYLSRYTRTQVLFPTKDLFMYSTDGKTLILRIR